LSQESTTEVIWWSENVVKLNGKSIRKGPIDFFIETDASKNGWVRISMVNWQGEDRAL
jgi:hypothetical protein